MSRALRAYLAFGGAVATLNRLAGSVSQSEMLLCTLGLGVVGLGCTASGPRYAREAGSLNRAARTPQGQGAKQLSEEVRRRASLVKRDGALRPSSGEMLLRACGALHVPGRRHLHQCTR